MTRAYWFRVVKSEDKCDVRIDCLALWKTIIDDQYPALEGNQHCFFTSDVSGGLDHVMKSYTSIELVTVDFSMADVNDITYTMQAYNLQTFVAYIHASHAFLMKVDSQKNCEYIDCKDDTSSVLSLLAEYKHRPYPTLCLQQCDCDELKQHAGFMKYISERGRIAAKAREEAERNNRRYSNENRYVPSLLKLRIENGEHFNLYMIFSRLT